MVKVAVGHVLRTAMKLVRGEALGRARASAVRDLAEAMAMVVSVVASCVEKVRESCGGVIGVARVLIGWSGKIASAKY